MNGGENEEQHFLVGGSGCALIFYKARNSKDEPLANRVAAFVTMGPISHVELRFSDGKCLSVYAGEEVFLRERTYTNPQYVQYHLAVRGSAEKKMREFAQAQVGKRFNGWGMIRSALPLMWRTSDGHRNEGKWFCSELIVAVLQAGGLCAGLNRSTVSPNTLYRFCKNQTGALRTALAVNPHNLARYGQVLKIDSIIGSRMGKSGQVRM